jgi:hypothetical protein
MLHGKQPAQFHRFFFGLPRLALALLIFGGSFRQCEIVEFRSPEATMAA